MAQNELDKLLTEAVQAFHRAVDARLRGKLPEARAGFLSAAEKLMQAAGLSKGELRDNRKRLANELLSEAKAIKLPPAPIKAPSTTASTPASTRVEGAKTPTTGDDEQANSWLVREKPSTRFDDIAGLEQVKEQIRLKLLYPFSHPELADQYNIRAGGGILLYGPPGTGKTMIARAIAGEIDAAFFAIKPSEIMSQWVGIAEQNISRLFVEAQNYPLSVVFIDELESLAPKRRSSGSTVMVRVVPQLLAELDGFEKRQNPMLFVGATNEPWSIDPAILRPGRLDRLIYVPPPDPPARRKILELNLKQAPLGEDIDLDAVSARTESFSGADMAALAQRVRERVFSEVVVSGAQRALSMADFDAVLEEMGPSVQPEELKLYADYEAKMRKKLG